MADRLPVDYCFALVVKNNDKTGVPSTSVLDMPAGIPEGYLAIPIQESGLDATVRLCALARQAPDPATGQLVVLRDLPDATIYLGCLTDAGGRLREWIELWVQNVEGLETSLQALRETCSNHGIDQRWAKTAKSFCALDPDGFIQTGWETKHTLPTFLDLGQRRPVHPGLPDKRWELCQDNAALKAAELPTYDTSLFRYLYQPASKGSGFIAMVNGAPTNLVTHPIAEALPETQALVPFNPQGGLLMAQRFSPLGYEEYVDLLGGEAWKGIEHGKHLLKFNGVYRGLEDWGQMQQSGSHLFLGQHGRSGRFVETYHLKLQLLVEVFASVRAFVEQQQLPFLNLAADSFRVRLSEVGTNLPFLWTAKCALVKPSQAYALPVETSDFRYFIRARPDGTSIYHPEGLNVPLQSNGKVRIRRVLPPDAGGTRIEGTLIMQERMNISPHDLLWIRLRLPTGRIDLYGHVHTTDGLAQGEARFQSVAQKFGPKVVDALRAAEGVSFGGLPYEVIPLFSTPCDLYALGVLAVRTFLVNPQNTLAVALDEMLSLARQVAAEYSAETPLASRICSILNQDPRFAQSLAPHRLVQEPMEPMAAYELLPPELWYHTLATIVRLFPGLGPDSHCKDYGDAPALALESVFAQPLDDLEKLLRRSRSLIVIDWNANREIHSAIRDVLDRQHL